MTHGRLRLLLSLALSLAALAAAVGIASAATFIPDIKAADPETADNASTFRSTVTNINRWYSTAFNYRPQQPVTFLMFSDAAQKTDAVQSWVGRPLTQDEKNVINAEPAYFFPAKASPKGLAKDGYVIAVNMDFWAGWTQVRDQVAAIAFQAGWQVNGNSGRRANNSVNFGLKVPGRPMIMHPLANTDYNPATGQLTKCASGSCASSVDTINTFIKNSMNRAYAFAMMQEVGGSAGPAWYREGVAEWMANQTQPFGSAAVNISFWKPYLVQILLSNQRPTRPSPIGDVPAYKIPTLRALTADPVVASKDITLTIVNSIAVSAVNGLGTKIGHAQMLDVLKQTASGKSFEAALTAVSGMDLDRLDATYKSNLPDSPDSRWDNRGQ